MSGSSNPPPRTGGLSLYANLLDPSLSTTTTASIQRAPIVFNKQAGSTDPTSTQDETASSAAQKKLNAAALRFQPTKRPQVNQPKAKPKIAMKPLGAIGGGGAAAATASATTANANSTTSAATGTTAAVEPARPVVKTTLNDWAHTGNSDDDVNGFYASKERERNQRRKKRRKNKESEYEPVDWDDIYDPARPNNYEEYRDGDEKIREMDEWRDRLYGPRKAREESRSDEDSEDDYRPAMNSRFAPPKFNFAPPPPAAPVEVPDDATGEDAYARRVRLSQMGASGVPPPPPPPPPPPVEEDDESPYEPTDELITESAPSILKAPAATISRAPVLYQPSTQSEPPVSQPSRAEKEPSNDEADAYPEDEPRSLRPGQKGFAHRLLAKYGWTKGTGLGAEGTGIVKPLHVVASKKKEEIGRGKIIDKNKRKDAEADSKFGKMTEVVVLRGMLRGIDTEEIVSGELRQEIGEECGEKYGRVERVYIHTSHDAENEEEGPKVFVQFTTQLSALKAVNALEGRLFNGNPIDAKYYDKDKFEKGIYE